MDKEKDTELCREKPISVDSVNFVSGINGCHVCERELRTSITSQGQPIKQELIEANLTTETESS